jgi:hypothetical protein
MEHSSDAPPRWRPIFGPVNVEIVDWQWWGGEHGHVGDSSWRTATEDI